MSSTRPKSTRTKVAQAIDQTNIGSSRPRTSGSGSRAKPRPGLAPTETLPSQSARVQPKSAARVGTKALVPRGTRQVSRPLEALTNPDKRLVMKKHNGLLHPEGYSVKPVIPAEKAELISVARAMNREEFGPRLQKLFHPETEAATDAIQSGVYIGWRCPEFTWDCIRVGRESRCFCGHLLKEHAPYNGRSVRVPCRQCPCKAFAFIPGRPEDIGEFWFQRRRNFDPTTWRAKCRCKHTHEEHACTGMRRCKMRSCGCGVFNSNFLCAACDRHWEDHETVFETESERHDKKIPYGEDYLPFAEMPDLRNMALTGVDSDPGIYKALVEGQGNIPRGQRAIGQNTPVKPPPKSGFNPVWD
ncbi:protein FAM221B-like [Asterias rubens]|uniref:protein FAM221B-like n=1 Tax=Asterias rubens TaxID=7604 RepID=UPI001455D68B|nr:protein FAM221B-like [Asterias rubens]XP_033634896.1 protein FAM221B-like [Asterias rubens]